MPAACRSTVEAHRFPIVKLTFLGATGTVTGSRYLLEHHRRRLLVDSRLFQGLKQLRLRNWDSSALPCDRIEAVVLSHAHLDHSGYLPKLVQLGFRGAIRCTAPTHDLCRLLLAGSARLLEEEAQYANRHGWSKHHPALPLYTEADALRALKHIRRVEFEKAFEPIPGVRVRLHGAGHLIGAASIRVEWGDGRSLLFSGDLGRGDDLLMAPPSPPAAADGVVMESTYGDRLHPTGDPLATIAAVVSRTAARGGVVIVPSFAVGRAQALLYGLHLLKAQRRIPDLAVFLNSPMAADATRIYHEHRAEHRLTPEQCQAMCTAAKIVNSVEESLRLNNLRMPAVIISASGMASGGRVLHHLKATPRTRATPSSSSATRRWEPAARRWSPARAASRSTASTCRSAPRWSMRRASPRTRTATGCSPGSALCRAHRVMSI